MFSNTRTNAATTTSMECTVSNGFPWSVENIPYKWLSKLITNTLFEGVCSEIGNEICFPVRIMNGKFVKKRTFCNNQKNLFALQEFYRMIFGFQIKKIYWKEFFNMLEAVNGLCSMGLTIKLIAFYCVRFRGEKEQ